MCAERRVWECGIAPATKMCRDVQYLCALNAYVSVVPAFIPVLPANPSVSARVKKRGRHFTVWVAGICLSIAHAFFPLFLCLSLCQTDSRKCLLKERSRRSRLEGSPERETWSPSISVGIWDRRRTDKMPSGQLCVLRQTEI